MNRQPSQKRSFTRVWVYGLLFIGLLWVLGVGRSRPDYRPHEVVLTHTVLANADLFNIELQIQGIDWTAAGVGEERLSDSENLFAVLERTPAMRLVLSSMPENLIADPDHDGARAFCDAWGHEIIYVPADTQPAGGPIRSSPYFISPGPDGRVDTPEDNLYSFSSHN